MKFQNNNSISQANTNEVHIQSIELVNRKTTSKTEKWKHAETKWNWQDFSVWPWNLITEKENIGLLCVEVACPPIDLETVKKYRIKVLISGGIGINAES